MFLDIVQALQGPGRKVVLLHGNADPDALGSAFAIQQAFGEVTIAAPGGMDRVSKVVASKLSIEVMENVDLSEFDLVAAVDSSSAEQLGVDGSLVSVVIDHHAPTGQWTGPLHFIDESRRSCAEIVLDLLHAADHVPDRRTGLALAAGMLTDSGHFRFANAALLDSMASVLREARIGMDEVMDLTEMESDVSERVSQLKGAQPTYRREAPTRARYAARSSWPARTWRLSALNAMRTPASAPARSRTWCAGACTSGGCSTRWAAKRTTAGAGTPGPPD